MSYRHFTAKERHMLMYLLHWKLSYREIGRRLGRHHTTIAREVKRNGRRMGNYRDESAHQWAQARRVQPRHERKQSNERLRCYVLKQLEQDWSPETISGRLTIDFPRHHRMRMSSEGIYRWVYQDAIMGGTLYQHLLRRHKKRRQQCRYGTRGFIPGRISIHERPVSIAFRRRFGHWESDSVEGAKGSGGIATHVERKSRLLVAARLADKKAETFSQATIMAFTAIPKKWCRTFTVDNGKEFSTFKKIEQATGMLVYFADPYSPWQRGTSENTNGLLRHYFPKGINWRTVTEKALAVVVNKLNNRPRKCLGYRTPNEVFLRSTGGALGT
jgi:transposase, IS30 family